MFFIILKLIENYLPYGTLAIITRIYPLIKISNKFPPLATPIMKNTVAIDKDKIVKNLTKWSSSIYKVVFVTDSY